MALIPKQFTTHPKISLVLHYTVEEFNFEEQAIIYLYYLANTPIEEIAHNTALSSLYVTSTITLYAQRLDQKVQLFKRAVAYNPQDLITTAEMFQHQFK